VSLFVVFVKSVRCTSWRVHLWESTRQTANTDGWWDPFGSIHGASWQPVWCKYTLWYALTLCCSVVENCCLLWSLLKTMWLVYG